MYNLIYQLTAQWEHIREEATQCYHEFAYRPECKHWHDTDSQLKYIDHLRALDTTGAKYMILAAYIVEQLKPFDVVEFGPGACFLGAYLKQCGVNWRGYDLPKCELYQQMAQRLKVDVLPIEIKPCKPFREIETKSSLIVMVQCCFMNSWTECDFGAFILNCKEKLRDKGNVLMFLNPQAMNGQAEEIIGKYRHKRVMLPILGNGWQIKKDDM